MRKRTCPNVTDTALQSTLREIERLARSPKVWVTLLILSAVLGASGPFDTYTAMAIGPRFAYWLVVAISTFFIGVFFDNWITRSLVRTGVPRWPALAIGSAIAGIVVAALVVLVNRLSFGSGVEGHFSVVFTFLYVVPISVLIAFAYVILTHSLEPTSPAAEFKTTETQPRAARLLERLQPQNRGALVSLSVSDHYVDVITLRGHELILIRLSDAIAETEGTPGYQIHRSHWVAEDQIAGIVRKNGKIFVATSAGDELPVSRTYQPVLKEAKLLI